MKKNQNTSEVVHDPSDSTRISIETLLSTVCGKHNINYPSKQALIDRSVIVIPQLLQKMEPKDFYQWFCPLWQAFEYLYSLLESEDAWPELVGKFAKALTERENEKEEFTHPSLRAMCVSFMLNSLNSHVVAQSFALRMLVLFATRTPLCKNSNFVHWLLIYMDSRIDNIIEIKDDKQRDLFTNVCVGFFDSIPVFDSLSTINILKFFGAAELISILTNSKEQKPHLESIAAKTFNTTLADDSFFIFEVIRNTKLIYDNLNKDQQELLNIFVSGGINDFDKFVADHKDYLSKDHLNIEKMRDKMLVLSFVSLAHGYKTLKFSEAQNYLNLDEHHVKKLCVRVNATDAAKLSVDSINGQIIVDYCQPRQMTDNEWDSMADRLQCLEKSLLPKE